MSFRCLLLRFVLLAACSLAPPFSGPLTLHFALLLFPPFGLVHDCQRFLVDKTLLGFLPEPLSHVTHSGLLVCGHGPDNAEQFIRIDRQRLLGGVEHVQHDGICAMLDKRQLRCRFHVVTKEPLIENHTDRTLMPTMMAKA